MGRASITPRCIRCRMHLEKCLCAQVPRLDLPTGVTILMHIRETFKITNSARLLTLALPNSEIRRRGIEPVAEPPLLSPGERPIVLFPTEDATVLTPQDGPVRLIVPDGTWRQARKIARREPELEGLPCYRLPPGPPSRYFKRKEHDINFVCTFEAVTRALAVLEGPAVAQALDRYFSLIAACW